MRAQALEREKALVLRSIKELEFDHAMRKTATADFEEMRDRLRRRAVGLMQQLDASGYRTARRSATWRVGAVRRGIRRWPARRRPERARPARTCAACQTANDADARFCKRCGAALARPA